VVYIGAMEISYFGNSYFVLKINDLRIAIDPHDGESIGLKRWESEAEILIISHDHYDHNAKEVIRDKPQIINREGFFDLKEVKVKTIKYYHDQCKGKLFGHTLISIIYSETGKIIHFGDIGAIPSERIISELKNPLLALIPAGGVTTIDSKQFLELVDLVKPEFVIPMHYWIKGLYLPINELDLPLIASKYPTITLKNKFKINELKKELIY
jgi:hypothetical protein